MLPVLPSKTTPEIDDLIVRVLSSSAALGRGIHPHILEEIARLMVKVNSYYTNAMEGNPSKLKDIDAALNTFRGDRRRRIESDPAFAVQPDLRIRELRLVQHPERAAIVAETEGVEKIHKDFLSTFFFSDDPRTKLRPKRAQFLEFFCGQWLGAAQGLGLP